MAFSGGSRKLGASVSGFTRRAPSGQASGPGQRTFGLAPNLASLSGNKVHKHVMRSPGGQTNSYGAGK